MVQLHAVTETECNTSSPRSQLNELTCCPTPPPPLTPPRPPHLSDGHGAEDVEKDEGAVGVVLTRQVAVGNTLDQGDGGEGKVGHHSPIKSAHSSLSSALFMSWTY